MEEKRLLGRNVTKVEPIWSNGFFTKIALCERTCHTHTPRIRSYQKESADSGLPKKNHI